MTAIEQIRHAQQIARQGGPVTRPAWPMIVLATPKGWTGPKHGGWPRGGRQLAIASDSTDSAADEP